MRLAFLGLPLAALLLHADQHDIVIAGVRAGLTTGARRLRRTIGLARVVVDPQRDWEAFRHLVASSRADLLVSWFFTRKIPMPVVDACRLGGIGVHPSLLPKYRGPDPFFAAIDAGESETGVTVHRIEESYDTGAIIAQRTLAVDPRWNAWQLARRLDRPSLSLLREVVGRAQAGDDLQGEAQDESLASAAPVPPEDARAIVWTAPAAAIVRRIRALSPNPGALAFAGHQVLIVQEAEIRPVHAVLQPGEAGIIDGVAVIRAQDTGVALLRAEVDGVRWDRDRIAHLIARCRSNWC